MKQDILKMLDKKQSNYEFPALDNAVIDTSQVKFSILFRNKIDWLMVFQFVGVDSLGISNHIQVYGDGIEYSIIDDRLIQLREDEYEIFDNSGEFLLDLYNGQVLLRGHKYEYNFTKKHYEDTGIDIKNIESYPTYLIRMIAEDEKAKSLLWWNKQDITEALGINDDCELWYETEGWQHVEDEKISENKFFQSVALAIENRNLNLIVTGEVNTHWKNWTEFDYENSL
ncbi:Uncharacterized protein BC141101_06069 [Bacillus toyonensis]|uniref:DUF7003 family protein n=1 Tax=Bacillus TaxID=1386 RepID=UPI0001A09BB9|nr:MULTISPECIES: hypothetical protein [Bacillus cereus group]EEL31202.1 hypothetical protein bcere0019_56470 [Bacillus cereus Rock3-28]EEL37108.1 hypothetical protein bcere0020_55000 [Bacillus cereus Rock3-29]EJV90564.1 hypothetical protein IGI_05242 [Bacillus toyonensis]EOP45955.1 hypothetical protein IKI_05224 [Bacillus toyonensis]MBE7139839.1 hypothetical protein [Bacillus toyonensis]